jgi:type I restriction-modification system DNA methylase subunit
MLGRIFEKMISISPENIDEIVNIYENKKKVEIDKELNKKFGAFYTPREIVHYMTKESIISYLLNNLKGKREENEVKVRTLFDLKEKFLVTKADITEEIFDDLANIIEDIDEKLQKVKILDPAIGSGAFPMGILHEVSTIRYYIYGAFYKVFGMNSNEFKNKQGKISMYKIKRDIIQNNIY